MMRRPEEIQKTAPQRLEVRHRVSGLNSRFHGDGLAFADYVIQSREMIARARTGTDAAKLEKIIAGNAPFQLEPETATSPRRGILLIHGLTDSPYFMRHLAAFFQQHGFRVMAILLPGHGTQPGDLLDVNWREWSNAVSYGTDRLANEVDEIYLGGFSAGGALSIHQSLHDNRVRGLFLFSPALGITSRAAHANLHKLYSWLMPSAKWVGIMPDVDIYKYESFPKNAAAQMYALTQATSQQLQQHAIDIPVFIAASRDDATVEISATLEFMAHALHPSSRLVLYTTDTANFPPNIPREKLELINSVVPEQKILSSAHTAIVLPPDDAHYGAAGDYSNCLHYFQNDIEKYATCSKNSPTVWQGEITEANLRAGIMRRLMYNPYFAELKVSMQKFIESLP
jgi:esterase/lipase